jgi:hypothetical protein
MYKNHFKTIKIEKAFYSFKRDTLNIILTKKNLMYLALLVLFAGNLYMYATGSFAYGYLEDDDPWTHAREMKYVSIERTLDVPYFRPVNYLDPYPPAYSLIMGILHQTSPEAQWTLKFFNSLIISLSIIFFFFMVNALTKNGTIALSSSFILSMLPSYLSHFIWSHSLIPFLFFLLIYSYTKIYQRRWWLIATVATAGIFLTHSRQVIKLAVLALVFFGVKWYYTKKFPKKIFIASILGMILSLSWWAVKGKRFLRMVTESGTNAQIAAQKTGESSSILTKLIAKLPLMFAPDGGTASRAYTFNDFFIVTGANHINSPIGWGIVITLLTIFGFVVCVFTFRQWKKQRWIPIVVGWFILTFVFVNSATFHLPFGIAPFRIWMLLAIPVSILAGYGLFFLGTIANALKEVRYLEQLSILRHGRHIKYFIILIVILGVIWTSGVPKYQFNTSPTWPPGGKWTSWDELQGYLWMKEHLPLNAPVLTYSNQNKVVIGFNLFACVWCEDFRAFKENILEKDIDTVHQWMVEHGYQYLAFGGMEVKYLGRKYGEEIAYQLINQRIQEANDSPTFALVWRTSDFVLFEVK